jgi:hypothetical protein
MLAGYLTDMAEGRSSQWTLPAGQRGQLDTPDPLEVRDKLVLHAQHAKPGQQNRHAALLGLPAVMNRFSPLDCAAVPRVYNVSIALPQAASLTVLGTIFSIASIS